MALKPENIVHFAIDIQKREDSLSRLWNSWTEGMSRQVAAVAPRLNAMGVPTVWFHLSKQHCGPLRHVRPAPGDREIQKRSSDAFGSIYSNKSIVSEYRMLKEAETREKGRDLEYIQYCLGEMPVCRLADEFMEAGRRTALISGMNLNVCVYETCRSALEMGFNVIVMTDCVAIEGMKTLRWKSERAKAAKEELEALGARFMPSGRVLHELQMNA